MGITFGLTVFAWIFFRAESIGEAFAYISGITSYSILTKPTIFPLDFISLIAIFIMVEWIGRRKQYSLQFTYKKRRFAINAVIYSIIIWMIILWGVSGKQEFIYFQF